MPKVSKMRLNTIIVKKIICFFLIYRLHAIFDRLLMKCDHILNKMLKKIIFLV